MIAKTINDLLSNTSEQVLTLSSARANSQLTSIGDRAGRGFELRNGDVISIPTESEIRLRVRPLKMGDKSYMQLFVTASINGSYLWLPIWCLRKKTPSVKEEPSSLRAHVLYQDLLHAENDLERVCLVMGHTWKVTEETASVIDKKSGQPYDLRIWTLEEQK